MVMRGRAGVAALVLSLSLAGCSVPGLWTYERAGTATSSATAGATDPTAYAESAWAAKVVPTISQKAVEATTLLPALKQDATAAASTYGIASVSGGAPTYMVKGSGTVAKIDTDDPQGPVRVELGGGLSIQIATGPVITGTALRDAVQIGFGEFTNQIDFQNVGTELNTKSKTEVIAKVDLTSLKGKKLAFEGAFTAASIDQVLVVPTKLAVS